MFKELEELRKKVDENEKIELANQTKKEETMRRIEQLFLEAELTNQENKEQVWLGNTFLNITNDHSKLDDYDNDEVKYWLGKYQYNTFYDIFIRGLLEVNI